MVTRVDKFLGGLGIDATNKFEVASNATVTVGNGTSTGNVTLGGNIVVGGTVDGRDLATDGTKLDGIESGATADQSASEILTLIKTVDGAGSGLDADTLDGVSSGSFLRSDATDSASGDLTLSGTVNVSGTLQLGGTSITSTATEVNYTDGVTSNIQTQLDGKLATAGGTMTGDVLYNDSVKAKFGTDSDLEIYHDGSNSYIKDVGTGNLNLLADGNVNILNAAGTEFKAQFVSNGADNLFYDNSKKFETDSAGVTITGNIAVTGTVDGRDIATDGTKLDGIESGATADQTASEILTAIKTVDGAGSGLDADTLDGIQANDSSILNPTGSIIMYGAASAPSGYYLCEGAAISRSTYSALFGVISTTYGAGDGSTTFNVPDFRDRAPYGASTFTLGSKTAGEVNASGQNSTGTGTSGSSGASTVANNTGTGTTGTGTTGTGTTGTSTSGGTAPSIPASTYNTGSGTSGGSGATTVAANTGNAGATTVASNTGSGGSHGHTVTTASTNSTTDKDVTGAIAAVTAVANVGNHTHAIPALTVNAHAHSIPSLTVNSHTHSVPALSIPAMTVNSHTHSVPGLSVPGLSVPGLSVPALTIPSLTVNGHTHSVPALTVTHPGVAVKFIIKT
jgi:microcystin-dependent protein